MRQLQNTIVSAPFYRTVTSGWLQFSKAIIAVKEKPVEVIDVICRQTRRNRSTRKTELKLYSFIYAILKPGVVGLCFLGRYPNGLLANHVTRTIYRIDAYIH